MRSASRTFGAFFSFGGFPHKISHNSEVSPGLAGNLGFANAWGPSGLPFGLPYRYPFCFVALARQAKLVLLRAGGSSWPPRGAGKLGSWLEFGVCTRHRLFGRITQRPQKRDLRTACQLVGTLLQYSFLQFRSSSAACSVCFRHVGSSSPCVFLFQGKSTPSRLALFAKPTHG